MFIDGRVISIEKQAGISCHMCFYVTKAPKILNSVNHALYVLWIPKNFPTKKDLIKAKIQNESKSYCFLLLKGTSSKLTSGPCSACVLTNSVLGFLNISLRMGQCYLLKVFNSHFFFTFYFVSTYLVCPHAFNIS